MPLYNAEAFVAEAIESVLAQSHRDWELIVVDDASTDNSCAVVTGYAEVDQRVRLICLPDNAGAAAARNRGTEEAAGRFIAFLDADDTWLDDKLRAQVQLMVSNNVHLSYTNYAAIDEAGNRTGLVFEAPAEMTYSRLLMTNYIGCSTAMYDVEFCGKRKFPNLRRRQDYGLWLSILKLPGVRARSTGEIQVLYRIRKNSISSNKLRAARYNWILYREVEGLGFFQSAFYLASYMIIGLVRRVGKHGKQ